MLRLARNIVFFPVSGASGAVKSKPACAGAGIAALAWKCSRIASNCARSGTDGSRRLFLFFDDAVLLCFAYVEILSAMELLRRRHVLTSSTLAI